MANSESAVKPAGAKKGLRASVITFFILSFLVSWGILLPEAAAVRGWLPFHVPPPVLLLSGFGPAIAALLVAQFGELPGSPRVGAGALLRRLARWRVSWPWYVVVLLAPALLFLIAVTLANLLGSNVDFARAGAALTARQQGISPWALLPVYFVLLFLSLLGEEIGWRGFALPTLLTRLNPLLASLVLGLAWGLWHLPMIWIPALGAGVATVPFGWFVVDIVGMSVLFTWVFLHTRGSLLLATLLHTANNTAAAFIPLLPPAATGLQPFLINVGLKWLVVIVLLALYGVRLEAPERAGRDNTIWLS